MRTVILSGEKDPHKEKWAARFRMVIYLGYVLLIVDALYFGVHAYLWFSGFPYTNIAIIGTLLNALVCAVGIYTCIVVLKKQMCFL